MTSQVSFLDEDWNTIEADSAMQYSVENEVVLYLTPYFKGLIKLPLFKLLSW